MLKNTRFDMVIKYRLLAYVSHSTPHIGTVRVARSILIPVHAAIGADVSRTASTTTSIVGHAPWIRAAYVRVSIVIGKYPTVCHAGLGIASGSGVTNELPL